MAFPLRPSVACICPDRKGPGCPGPFYRKRALLYVELRDASAPVAQLGPGATAGEITFPLRQCAGLSNILAGDPDVAAVYHRRSVVSPARTAGVLRNQGTFLASSIARRTVHTSFRRGLNLRFL